MTDRLTPAAQERAEYRTRVRARVRAMPDADLTDSYRAIRDELDRRAEGRMMASLAEARDRGRALREQAEADAAQRVIRADAAARSAAAGEGL